MAIIQAVVPKTSTARDLLPDAFHPKVGVLEEGMDSALSYATQYLAFTSSMLEHKLAPLIKQLLLRNLSYWAYIQVRPSLPPGFLALTPRKTYPNAHISAPNHCQSTNVFHF